MAEKFYTILTAAGKAKIANAIPTGQKINLTKMKFGDSNGAYYNPNENQTDLKHTVYECNVTTVNIDEKNPNWITLTSVIPPEIGGFTIREIGVYDDTNTLIAIGKYPETYKPILDNGSTKELYVKMTLEVSNTNSVELKVDPYIILATKKDVNEVNEKLSSQLEQKANKNELKSNRYLIRKDINKNFNLFNYPVGFNGTYKPVNIFTDGYKFKTDYYKENFKNTGGKNLYVTLNGSSSANGDKATPTTLANAILLASDGDTIIIEKGMYFRNLHLAFPITISKNINIITDEGTVLVDGDIVTYTKESGLWKATRSNTQRIVDIYSRIEYTRVNTLEECKTTNFSWYTDNTNIYVNSYFNPNNILIPLVSMEMFKIVNGTKNLKVYIENLDLLGGSNGCITTSKSSTNSLELILDNVKGSYSSLSSSNVFSFKGGNILLNKCKAEYGRKDGFNYTCYNDNSELVECNFVEIDCIGANNGIGDTGGTYNNGSTCHAGTKGIRINGTYYNNYGSNVADVQPNTKTLNLNCNSFDSASPTKDQYCTDFCTQQAGAEMWLYNCNAFGSAWSLYAMSGTTIHAINTLFDNKQGSGTFDIVNS